MKKIKFKVLACSFEILYFEDLEDYQRTQQVLMKMFRPSIQYPSRDTVPLTIPWLLKLNYNAVLSIFLIKEGNNNPTYIANRLLTYSYTWKVDIYMYYYPFIFNYTYSEYAIKLSFILYTPYLFLRLSNLYTSSMSKLINAQVGHYGKEMKKKENTLYINQYSWLHK